MMSSSKRASRSCSSFWANCNFRFNARPVRRPRVFLEAMAHLDEAAWIATAPAFNTEGEAVWWFDAADPRAHRVGVTGGSPGKEPRRFGGEKRTKLVGPSPEIDGREIAGLRRSRQFGPPEAGGTNKGVHGIASQPRKTTTGKNWVGAVQRGWKVVFGDWAGGLDVILCLMN